MSLKNKNVAVSHTELKGYPKTAPFDPPEKYPEYQGTGLDPKNDIYRWVRETLHRLGLDADHFGTPDWNPLGDVVKPGMTVFIKPNTVRHFHLDGKDVLSVIVHASIVRPMLDYVNIALKGEGRIIIGDSQVTAGKFEDAMDAAQITELIAWYGEQSFVPLECFDLRMNRQVRTWLYGAWGREKIEADPLGYQFVNLGEDSYFKDIDPKKLRIAIASYKNMYKHHSGGRHEYLFPSSVLQSDAIISIAKLKTHRRTGITVALKNFMGLPAWKDTLPHFMVGAPSEGGDQYINPSLRKGIGTHLHDIIQSSPFVPVKFVFAIIKKALWNTQRIIPFKDPIYEARWWGNDTLWRTLLDLNHAALYADKKGNMCDTQQREYFCLVDGIIAGEHDGPVAPDPVPAGVLLAGHNPVAVDSVASSLMGFDIDKIPSVRKALDESDHPYAIFQGNQDEIKVADGDNDLTLAEFQGARNLHFEPSPVWKDHIERD